MKNVFYYVSTPAIKQICDKYGDRLQGLSNEQKYELIGFMGLWLSGVERLEEGMSASWHELPGMPAFGTSGWREVSDILSILDDSETETRHVADFITAVSCQVSQGKQNHQPAVNPTPNP